MAPAYSGRWSRNPSRSVSGRLNTLPADAERLLLRERAMTEETRSLLIVSDRTNVWRDYSAPNRRVRRWIGERSVDKPDPEQGNFTGDPTIPETYRPAMSDHRLCAVFDIQDPMRARAAIEALRAVRPEAAVIVITANGEVQAPEIPLARHLEWTDALRVDLERELEQLEVQRC